MTALEQAIANGSGNGNPNDSGNTSTGDGTTSSSTGGGSSTPSLSWAGKTFTSKAEFNAWLKARGESAQSYFEKYPQAGSIYGSLPEGSPASTVGSGAVKGGKKKSGGSRKGRIGSGASRISTGVLRRSSAPNESKKSSGARSTPSTRPLPAGVSRGILPRRSPTEKRLPAGLRSE